MSNWKRYIQWAEWLLTIAAMGYLVYRLCTYEHYDTLGTTLVGLDIRSWMLCLLAVVLIPVQLFIEVLRWKATLRGWKTITLSESWSQVLLGMLAGFVTPYRTGDIPARLVAAGLDVKKEEWASRWRTWLKDWTKWLDIAGWTMARYIIWGLQLWAVMEMMGVHMSAPEAVGSIAFYYLMISIMPSVPAADVALKGGWAVWIFGQHSDNVVAILLAVTLIWFFNTIIPVFFGGIKKILYFCRHNFSN